MRWACVAALFVGPLFMGMTVSAVAEDQEALWQDVLENRRQCYSNIELASLKTDLSRERQSLEALQKEVISKQEQAAVQSAELDIERLKVEEKLAELKMKLSWQEKAAKADIGTLAELYEKMDSRQAAQAITGIPATFVAGLIAEMKTESAAKILKHVPADKMRQYTLALASRNLLSDQQ